MKKYKKIIAVRGSYKHYEKQRKREDIGSESACGYYNKCTYSVCNKALTEILATVFRSCHEVRYGFAKVTQRRRSSSVAV